MGDLVVRMTLEDAVPEGAPAQAWLTRLESAEGVDEVLLLPTSPEAERLDVAQATEMLGQVTLVLGVARITVDQAGALLRSITDGLHSVGGVRDAYLELKEGRRVPLEEATPEDVVAAQDS